MRRAGSASTGARSATGGSAGGEETLRTRSARSVSGPVTPPGRGRPIRAGALVRVGPRGVSPHDLREGGRMSGYAVARIDEIDEIDDGRVLSRPVRFHFGITSFGVNAFTADRVGDRLLNEHDESQEHDLQEELYLVQRGRATFELDGERVDAPAGTLVFVRPDVRRTAFAEEPGTTIVAVGGTPGKAYEAQGGEIWMPLNHLYESGQYAEAADQGRELIEAHPEYAGPLYNLACCESLAGRTDDAIRHLRLAIDRKESFRSLAAEDGDFDPIRAEAAFKELVQGNASPT